MTKTIYCMTCDKDVEARLTDGSEVYPHRPDLYSLPFWKCEVCKNFVGCHHKTNDPTRPMGVIPSEQLRKYRKHLHLLIDPLWQNGLIGRKQLYKRMSDQLGWRYHTATLRSEDEAKRAYSIAKSIKEELTTKGEVCLPGSSRAFHGLQVSGCLRR